MVASFWSNFSRKSSGSRKAAPGSSSIARSQMSSAIVARGAMLLSRKRQAEPSGWKRNIVSMSSLARSRLPQSRFGSCCRMSARVMRSPAAIALMMRQSERKRSEWTSWKSGAYAIMYQCLLNIFFHAFGEMRGTVFLDAYDGVEGPQPWHELEIVDRLEHDV